MSFLFPSTSYLRALTPSLRRASFRALDKLIDREINEAEAKRVLNPTCTWAKSEKSNALRRRRQLWKAADECGVDIGKPRKSGLSPAMLELIAAARRRAELASQPWPAHAPDDELDLIVLPYDAQALADDLDSVGRRAA